MSEEIVRTPTYASGPLTIEESVAMAELVKKWTAIAFKTGPMDKAAITKSIKNMYAVAKLAEPIVVTALSPVEMAIITGLAYTWWQHNPEGGSLTLDVNNRTVLGVWEACGQSMDSIPMEYINSLPLVVGGTEAEVITYYAGVITAALRSMFATDDAKNEAKNSIEQWHRVYQGGNMWASFPAYAEAMRDVIKLELPEFVTYQPWEDAATHGGFRTICEKFAVVSGFPVHIKIDENNQAHSPVGPSHLWPDGVAFYSWHGISIPGDWVTGNPPTPTEALTHENVELRRIACEIVGWENVISGLNPRVVDQDQDQMVGTLLEVELPVVGKELFLRVLCPTGRMFSLPVASDNTTARQANASTWGLTPDEYNPEVQT